MDCSEEAREAERKEGGESVSQSVTHNEWEGESHCCRRGARARQFDDSFPRPDARSAVKYSP